MSLSSELQEEVLSVCTRSTLSICGVFQALVLFVVISHNPTPSNTVYWTNIQNLTVGPDQSITLFDKSRVQNLPLTVVNRLQTFESFNIDPVWTFGISSLSVTAFTLFTQALLKDSEISISTQDYHPEVVQTILPWELIFWFSVLSLRLSYTTLLLSPSHVTLAPFASVIIYICLFVVCQPRPPDKPFSFHIALALCVYLFTAVIFTTNSHTHAVVMFAVLAADLLLLFGHTWDSVLSMDTIINCRLFYLTAFAAVNIAAYVISIPSNKKAI